MSNEIITKLSEWKNLNKHYEKMKDVHIRDLFEEDKTRAESFTIKDLGLYVDFFKTSHNN